MILSKVSVVVLASLTSSAILLGALFQPVAAGALTFYGECISEKAEGCISLKPEGSDQAFLVNEVPIVEPRHFANAELIEDDQIDEPVIFITFTEEGKARFAEASTARIGKSIYILDEGRLISAPTVREPILGGKGQISGGYTVETARDLIARILANR
jgi:preprotein translocase subunit SecD